MKSDQDRYFNCFKSCYYHEEFETPKKICLAALTDDPFGNPKGNIDQHWYFIANLYGFNFKVLIEDYCKTGKLTLEELHFMDREHPKSMSVKSEALSPSIAHWNICDACNLKQGSF